MMDKSDGDKVIRSGWDEDVLSQDGGKDEKASAG
jgi:hypothetical protein